LSLTQPDCHCLFPAIKSIPIETIELYYPLRIEVNEALIDSGGAGFYRGGNAQRTRYRFLCAGKINLHDDRALTRPWGCDGGLPGERSRKTLIQYSKHTDNPPRIHLGSKSDNVRVASGDVLEWVTWGGGGLGDPLTRPPAAVAADVQRRLVSVRGAATNYGVVMDVQGHDVLVDETQTLRAQMAAARDASASEHTGSTPAIYNRGGTLDQLCAEYRQRTGLEPPSPQWERDPYGPHVHLPYVQNWYREMREKKGWEAL
jgi:5-oxoprolinase (ATP-hydrolysing)